MNSKYCELKGKCKFSVVYEISNYIVSSQILLKIRIGYVLKSADVGTLFSSRYSENSSHTHTHRHPSTSTHTRAHHCTLKHTHAHQCKPMHTGAHPPSPAHNCAHRHPHTHTGAHPRTSAQAYAHPRTPRHTRAHLRTVDTPHIPADALNLINHLKLHVNGKMAEDR